MDQPFGHYLTCSAALHDTKCKAVRLKGVFHTRHRTYHRQAIGGIWNWAVNVAANATGPKQRHALHRVFNVPLQAVQIIGIQLEAEIVRHWIFFRGPMRLAVEFIWPKVQTIFVLAQIVAAIYVADHRCLAPVFLGPLFDLVNLFSQKILVRHHRQRHIAATERLEPLAYTRCIIPRRVHNFLAADIAFFRVNDPLIPIT